MPNLLLYVDNSASMFDLLYTDADGVDDYYCYDDTYDDSVNTEYAGYFDQAAWYEFSGGKFVTTTPPGACSEQTGYVCVDIDTSVVPHILNQFKATGKFLNWLSTSKFDVQKRILTGGKYSWAGSALVGESRGCFGRSFVKEVPVAGFDATFTVRGPEPKICEGDGAIVCETDADCGADGPCIVDILDTSDGGLTEIEIWSGNYDQSACQDAIEETMYGSLGPIKKAIDDCLEAGPGPWQGGHGQDTIDQNAAFNQSIQTCWHGSTQNWGHSTSLSNQCDKIYDAGTDPHDIPLTSRAAVCSYAYIGVCWEEDIQGEGPHDWPASDQCYQDQMDLWCHSFEFPSVVDPSDTSTQTEEHGNIPGMLWHAAVDSQLGEPIGTFPVLVDSNIPFGLVHEFSSRIRFGVMAFNYLGSDTECAAFPDPDIDAPQIAFACNEIGAADKDAGQVIARIGSDLATIIPAINDLRGETWTPYAEGFFNAIAYFTQNTDAMSGLPYRLNAADFDTTENPVQYECQANNILLISDGKSTTDQNTDVNDFVANNDAYNDPDDNQVTSGGVAADYTVEPTYFGSRNLDDLAWYAKNKNIFDPTVSIEELSETITTYVVYSGVDCGAKDGDGWCTTTDEAVEEKLMQETAENGGGLYQRAENPEALFLALRRAFQLIAARAASGTAASVLASGEGSGANLVQAIFYPIRSFGSTEITWIGSLKNLWYHIDPFLGNSSIREDTVADQNLILNDDYIVHFYFDSADNLTKANLFEDIDGDGMADDLGNPTSTVYFDNVKSLWESGFKLWERNPDTRTIYTTNDGSTRRAFDTIAGGDPLIDLLRADNVNQANVIIDYVRGTDFPNKFCSVSVGVNCTTDTDCPAGEECIRLRNRTINIGGTFNPWKLGDIINSTPRIVSWVGMNTYDDTYGDTTYENFVKSSTYTDRGMVIVGSNDGMLHAFKLGTLELYEERYKKAAISGAAASLGQEEWAYIPKHSLPYLKYLAYPDYCHIYYADATPYILDASIGDCGGGDYWDCTRAADGTTWRTVLIGGMRLGGACKNTCTGDINNDGTLDGWDCIETPDTDVGYSSYFALDITDPTDPQLLWEFSNEDIPAAQLATGGLGFATTGPAVVKISAETAGSPDKTKNGRWFVVFGSGPTGPIEQFTHQFRGYSDQPLKVFILDLATGQLLRTINSGIPYAFAGSLVDSTIDFDLNNPASSSNYQDDALYFGFTKSEDNNPDYDDAADPTKWNDRWRTQALHEEQSQCERLGAEQGARYRSGHIICCEVTELL